MKIYTEKTYYFATVTAGLEDVLADEIFELGITMNPIKSERGKVLFQSTKDINELLKPRCADNIYCVVCELPVGCHKKDLDQYAFDISRIEWTKTLSAFNVNDSHLTVSASRSGKATYSRFDIENATKAVLSKAGYSVIEKSGSALNMRVDFFNDFCRISIKLTNADFRFRGNTHIYAKGCIWPTVASALVRISKPSKTDVFYDPFCGSGTIVNAREKYPSKRILASDIDEEKVTISQKNCDGTAKIFKCNALNAMSKSNSIDVMVTNPPWNKQIRIDNIERFYIGFFAEAKRILKNDGQIILLTDCYDEVINAVKQNNMECIVLYELSLHGLRPKIYRITNEEAI